MLLDTISTGLSAPTSSGLGIAAATLSPAASYEIGQYFKSNDAEGSTAHILAHTLLGAAVAAAGGNDALTAGLAAGGAEASTPLLSSYLYGKEAKDLTADEKSTISSITGLVASGVGATTGDIGSTLQTGQSAQNAVDNNASIAGAYAKKKSEQYNDLCKQSGISAGQCSEWTGQRIINNSKELAMIIVPTEIYELIPVGKGAGIVSKATGKVIAKFDDTKQAKKVLENIKVSQEARNASNFDHHKAMDFYIGKVGYSTERARSHVDGIDFNFPVNRTTLKIDEKYVQHIKDGRIGNYFAPVGTPANHLGINPAGRVPITFAPVKETEALKSKAREIVDTWTDPNKPYPAKGDGTQYFVPNKENLKQVK